MFDATSSSFSPPLKQLCLVLLVSCFLTVIYSWKSDRRPRVFGDKLPQKFLLPTNREVQKKIVVYHNFFRTHVHPIATDMLAMIPSETKHPFWSKRAQLRKDMDGLRQAKEMLVDFDQGRQIQGMQEPTKEGSQLGDRLLFYTVLQTWHKGTARAAQLWADQCLLLTHDSPSGRWVDLFGSCGQNIFISTQQVPWFFAIKTWFLERHNFTYGSSSNSLDDVGHYTQLVWASTHKVGCGFAECKRSSASGHKYYSYVCNYCPIGNHLERLGRPYKKGKACASCPQHCRKQRLCTNSCGAADLWANCGELYRTWPQWLCRSDMTRQGRERRDNCRATCSCAGKIK